MPNGANQDICLGISSNGDAEILFHIGMTEPANQNFTAPKFFQPSLCGQSRRIDENEISLAGQDTKLKFAQFIGQPGARCFDALKVCLVVRQRMKSGFRRDLAETVHVVTVADLIQRSDQLRRPDKISHTLETE